MDMTPDQNRRRFLKETCTMLSGLSLYGCGGDSSETPTSNISIATIQRHPTSQTVSSGESVTFQVIASGSGDLSYQWRQNGVDIPGANQAVYTLNSTTITDNDARFHVLITNTAGTITSSDAILTVDPILYAPTITLEPADITTLIGHPATFQVTTDGTLPQTYQWQRDGQDIPNATEPSYTLTPASILENGNSFSVIITNQTGSVSSRMAILNVISTGMTVDTTSIRVDTTTITIDEI